MIYDMGYWRVPLTNRDEHREIMRAIYSNLKSKREKFSMISSQLFIMRAENKEFETWLYINVFADETAHAQNAKALDQDAKASMLRKQWESLILAGSFKAEMWKEFAPDL
ncbi:MAG TPA: hypothetical protein VJZ32_02875 [Candidatus Bathyarchaeia archaeon]|nr:hypothetical protein [Candidatus Bathyarchaeia archaeon]